MEPTHLLSEYSVRPQDNSRVIAALAAAVPNENTLGLFRTELGRLNRITWLRSLRQEVQSKIDDLPGIPVELSGSVFHATTTRLTLGLGPNFPEGRNVYELRRYRAAPGDAATFLDRYREIASLRDTFSLCSGFWIAQSPGFDELIHLWPYRDLEERRKSREAAGANPVMGKYALSAVTLLTEQNAEILVPVGMQKFR